jgi:hypothetical protein
VIDFGGLYPAALDVLDGSGNLVNAATVSLVITLPDGSAQAPAVPNPPASTGQYRYAYPTLQAGRHVVRWSTVDPVTSYTDVFDVAEEMPAAIVSLADAKRHLGISATDTSTDDDLRRWLAGCTRVVERIKNEVIVRRQVTQTERNHDPRRLRLWKVPVISLDSLARADGTHQWDVNSDVWTDPETGLVHLEHGGTALLGRLTAVSTAGYTVIPDHLLQGSLVLLQHVWETRRGPGTVGAGVVGPDEAMDYRQMFTVPRKVREWLGEPRPSVL